MNERTLAVNTTTALAAMMRQAQSDPEFREQLLKRGVPFGSLASTLEAYATAKADARNGRCACEWHGDKLAVVCLAHLTAVRLFDEPDRSLVKVPRWLIERAMDSCKVNNDGEAWQNFVALLDPSAFPDRAANVLATK